MFDVIKLIYFSLLTISRSYDLQTTLIHSERVALIALVHSTVHPFSLKVSSFCHVVTM